MAARSSTKQAGLFFILAFACLFALVRAFWPGEPAAPAKVAPEVHKSGDARLILAWEAEAALNAQAPFRASPLTAVSGSGVLEIEMGAGEPSKTAPAQAQYEIDLPAAGTYRLWVRAWWSDGCANSVGASFGDGPSQTVGNDGTYHAWHWVPGPAEPLPAGRQRISLWHREEGIRIDQLALGGEAYVPEGLLATQPLEPNPAKPEPPQVAEAPRPELEREPAAVAPETPAAAPKPEPPPQRPFRAGIAGSYRDGFEGHLVALGIPYVRLREHELGDLEALKNIDLLIVSDPRCEENRFWRALQAYVEGGGTAIVEVPPFDGRRRPNPDPENLLLKRGRFDQYVKQSILIADDSRFFRGVPKERAYHEDVPAYWLPYVTDVPGAKLYGVVAAGRSERRIGGALLVRELGQGRLYHLALPAAFAAMWRERQVDPYVVNILRDAIGGACTLCV
ncbi:MAG: hypothetical protein M5U26_23555 [Planctomycetota bacterium]|nr:hypothetical protein [Planctomycetota bacterium]